MCLIQAIVEELEAVAVEDAKNEERARKKVTFKPRQRVPIVADTNV